MISYDILVNRENISNLCTCTFTHKDLSCLLLQCMYGFFFHDRSIFLYILMRNTLFYTFQVTSFKGVLVEEAKQFFILFLKGEVLTGEVVLCQRRKAFV